MYFFLGDILRKVIECADFVENYYPYVVYRINLFNFFPSSRAFFYTCTSILKSIHVVFKIKMIK
jgi:hypothetical protein